MTSGRPSSTVRVVDDDPVVAGERDLEAAAERGAVDRGDDRLAERLEPAQVGLDAPRPSAKIVGGVVGVGLRSGRSGRRRRRRSSWREVTTTPVIVVLLGLQPVDGRVHRRRGRASFMVLALAVGSSRVRMTMPSASLLVADGGAVVSVMVS